MTSRKTLILGVAVAVVVTVPTVAWALNDPLGADPQPPPAPANAVTDAPYGWMGEMHDYMWNNGELRKDLPSDAADRMNQMHGSMRGNAPLDGSFGWMGQMHDYMWNNGELPDEFPAEPCPMGAGMWGGR